ncbi:MAG: substrate-binding domain-containing protein [Clostridiales bacterium]|jgi:ribose transport system substrate-binding protein|nr:substrate-binding domain-containing protein [Clostridiales bacterium]
MRARRAIAFAFATFFLAACQANAPAPSRRYVALVSKTTTNAFWKYVYAGANVAATEYNLALTMDGPENEKNYVAQNKLVEKAVADGAEAIVFSAIDYNASTKTIQEAVKKGVKIIVIDSDVNSDQVSCRIGTDNYAAGCMAAKAAMGCEEGVLNIGIVNIDKNTANGQQREQGFRDEIAKDMRVAMVQTVNAMEGEEEALEKTKQLLLDYPGINVLVGLNEWTGLGISDAVEELGLAEKTLVVAFDNNVRCIRRLESGEVDALIVQNSFAMGYLGIESAYKLLKGGTLPERINTDITLITRENMYDEDCQKVLFMFD